MIHRLINDIASIITLAITTGLVAGAILIGVFYAAYQALIRNGFDVLPAQLMIATFALFTLLVLVSFTSTSLGKIKRIPGQIINTEFPLTSRMNNIADSFLDGFLNARRK